MVEIHELTNETDHPTREYLAKSYARLLTMTDMIKDTHMVIGLLSIFMIINTIISIATLIAVLIA